MANRLIREGWLDSEAIEQLSPEAERFFFRLCLCADDAGRFDGRVEILRSRLFPLKIIPPNALEGWSKECISQGLMKGYEWQGKPFLQIAKWNRSSPAKTSRFPDDKGSHLINYIHIENRDNKEFVTSSLWDSECIAIPSVTHSEPLPIPSTPFRRALPETETETETNRERERVSGSDSREGSKFPTVPEAIEFCKGQLIRIPDQVVEEWHSNRDSQGWVKNSGVSITNWQSDLRSWVLREQRKPKTETTTEKKSKYAGAF